MKHFLPTLLTMLTLAALCASLAYWTMQFYQPAGRPLAVLPAASAPEPPPEAAGRLFGGEAVAAAVASNYQLRGVIAARYAADSVAIVSVDGKAARAVRVGKEVAPGVTVKEVQPRFAVLSDGGVIKRIELAADAKGSSASTVPSLPSAPAVAPPAAPAALPAQMSIPNVPAAAMMPGQPRPAGPPAPQTSSPNVNTLPPGVAPAPPQKPAP